MKGFYIVKRGLLTAVLIFGFILPTQSQIVFEGFQSNCSQIRFRATNFPSNTDRFVWYLDGLFQQVTTTPVFLLSNPGTTIKVYFQEGIPVSPFYTLYVNIGDDEESVPTLPTFFISESSYLNTLCSSQQTIVTLTANRCVGSNSWSASVSASPSATSGGLNVNLNSAVANVPSSIRATCTAGFGWVPTGSYTVTITGVETLSGSSAIRNFLIINSSSCGGWWREGMSPEEEQAISDAINGLSPQEWNERRVDEIARRYFDNPINTNQLNDFTQADLSVFPNPATDQFTVRYSEQPQQLRLLDLNGRVLRNYAASQLPTGQMTIPTADLPNGLYLLDMITVAGERQSTKLQITQ